MAGALPTQRPARMLVPVGGQVPLWRCSATGLRRLVARPHRRRRPITVVHRGTAWPEAATRHQRGSRPTTSSASCSRQRWGVLERWCWSTACGATLPSCSRGQQRRTKASPAGGSRWVLAPAQPGACAQRAPDTNLVTYNQPRPRATPFMLLHVQPASTSSTVTTMTAGT
jgi:hypothetical protein